MNEPVKVVTKEASARDVMREHLLGATPLAKSTLVKVFDMEIELRQPSFKDIMIAKSNDNPAERAAEMIVKYACVPETSERIFEDSDIPKILEWPFGEDLTKINTVIMELTGVDMEAIEKELEENPLAGSSTNTA